MFERLFEFEWDPAKAASNLRKHGVSFEEAASSFDDPLAFTQLDEWHSDDEPRETLLGHSNRRRLLVVTFIQRASHRIRLISARKATPKEYRIYEKENYSD